MECQSRAHLDLNCHAGVASVGLRLHLGHAPGSAHHKVYHSKNQNHRKSCSPSYQRRRERRAAVNGRINEPAENAAEAFTDSAEKASTDNAVEASNENTKEVATENANEMSTKNAEEASNVENSDTINSENDDKKENERENVASKGAEVNDDNVDEQTDENQAMQPTMENHEIDDEGKDDENEFSITKECLVSQPSSTIPDVIAVFCTATVENCPDFQLNEEYGDSIRRFILS